MKLIFLINDVYMLLLSSFYFSLIYSSIIKITLNVITLKNKYKSVEIYSIFSFFIVLDLTVLFFYFPRFF